MDELELMELGVYGMSMAGDATTGELALDPTEAAPAASAAVARALWVVASFTLVVDLSAGLYQPATGPVFGTHRVAYYAILVAMLAVVGVEMATAFWLSRRSGRRLLTFGRWLLCFATVQLLIAAAVGGIAIFPVKA